MTAVNHFTEPSKATGLSWAERRDLALYRGMRSLPVPAVSRIGAALGHILGRRAHPAADARVAAALRLLRPDLAADSSALEAAKTRLWANVGRVYAEFCVLDKMVPEGRVTIDDPGTVDAVLADGRPIIVAFVHLGNWETIIRLSIGRTARPIGVLANPGSENRVRAQIAAMQRERVAATVIPFDEHVWRRSMQHLERSGAILGVAVDELAAGRVATPAFGRELDLRGNLGKIVRIAARVGAIILPMHSERIAGASFVTRVLAPLEFAHKTKLDPEAHLRHVARLDAQYAPAVLRLIDQWFGLLEYR